MKIAILAIGTIVYYVLWIVFIRIFQRTFQIKNNFLSWCGFLFVGTIPLFCVVDYIWRGIKGIEILAYLGYIEVSFLIYFGLSFCLILLIRKLYLSIKKSKEELVKRSYIFIASLMSVLICLWGILAAHIPQYTNQNINIGAKESMKIVAVSDIHFGATGSFLSLEKMVHNINSVNPDVVFLIGDVFDNKIKNLDQSFFINTMNQLKSKYGIYAVTGNHEFMQNSLAEIKDFYNGSQIRLLLDEEIIINDIVRVVGRIDDRGGRKALKDVVKPSSLPLIVLDHQPQFYKEAIHSNAAIQLSGHTHNGQIFPGNIMLGIINKMKFDSPIVGAHYYNDFLLSITRGYGTWGIPMRLTGSSEILILNLN